MLYTLYHTCENSSKITRHNENTWDYYTTVHSFDAETGKFCHRKICFYGYLRLNKNLALKIGIILDKNRFKGRDISFEF